MSRERSPAARKSREASKSAGPAGDAGPLDWLPRVSRRQLGLEQWLERWTRGGRVPPHLEWLHTQMRIPIAVDRPEILWRASGLGRAGLVAQMSVSVLATRLGIGVEIPVAHAIVDRLLGFDRLLAESRNQLTPVEWGVWTFLFVQALESFDPPAPSDSLSSLATGGDRRRADLTIDRVGPDPFDTSGLGTIVTVRWPVRIGDVSGSVRLWLPEPLISHWRAAPAVSPAVETGDAISVNRMDGIVEPIRRVPHTELAGCWRAEAGFVTMSSGLKRLRKGGVLPLAGSCLTGTPATPSGQIALILDLDGQDVRFQIPVEAVADSGGRIVRIEAGPVLEPRARDPIDATQSETESMSQPAASTTTPSALGPLDVPVTLTVELGRVNLTLAQLADLKPGDVVELNRHSRAPVELTSNGRLVARGELILIDTDLGVRISNVFL